MLNNIQFRRKDGTWSFVKRANFSLLVQWIKNGEVDALKPETISAKEAEILRQEGFSLIPDEIVVGIGPARRTHKILRIERS